jgi:hypothetical protein
MDQAEFKYPKTWHFPWTMASTSDDKILSERETREYFEPMRDCFTSLKKDGENTTIGKGFSHARSLTSVDHWSRHHIKQLAANLYKDIEPGWRICGENLLALHSIPYHDLDSFFYVFSIWNEKNERLQLDDMLEYCDFLGLTFVPIINRGKFIDIDFRNHFGLDLQTNEGYVTANSNSFHYADTKKNMAKVVRPNHVQPDENHWMFGPVRKNSLC